MSRVAPAWKETISLREPLREVICLRPGTYLEEAVVDWEARLRERETAGYERGRIDGEKALSEQLLRQRNELLQVHQGVVESLRHMVPDLIRETENTLINLALETARKLVAGLAITPEMIEAVVREALGEIEESTEFSIYLHPADLALLKQVNSPLLTPAPGEDRLRFHASSEVTRGGCIVQTHFGILDARRDTKFEQLRKTLGLADAEADSADVASNLAPAS